MILYRFQYPTVKVPIQCFFDNRTTERAGDETRTGPLLRYFGGTLIEIPLRVHGSLTAEVGWWLLLVLDGCRCTHLNCNLEWGAVGPLLNTSAVGLTSEHSGPRSPRVDLGWT